MSNLEALARFLAANPADVATLAAFVDLLKDAEPERAMESIRLLMEERVKVCWNGVWNGLVQGYQNQPMPVVRIPPQITPVRITGDVELTEDQHRRWNDAAEEARRQRERDEVAGRIFYVSSEGIDLTAPGALDRHLAQRSTVSADSLEGL